VLINGLINFVLLLFHTGLTTVKPEKKLPTVIFVVLQPQCGSWTPLRGFVVTLTGHTIFGKTFLDECSAQGRDLYLTKHNTNNRQTDRHVLGCTRIHNLSRRAATNLRPRGQRDRPTTENEW